MIVLLKSSHFIILILFVIHDKLSSMPSKQPLKSKYGVLSLNFKNTVSFLCVYFVYLYSILFIQNCKMIFHWKKIHLKLSLIGSSFKIHNWNKVILKLRVSHVDLLLTQYQKLVVSCEVKINKIFNVKFLYLFYLIFLLLRKQLYKGTILWEQKEAPMSIWFQTKSCTCKEAKVIFFEICLENCLAILTI